MQLQPTSRPTLAQLVLGIAICEGAGLVGALWTFSALKEWYPSLIKPIWTPPSWIFGPLWMVLYALMGAALAYLWSAPAPQKPKRLAMTWFWAQLVLNVVWCAAFFGLRSPAWGYFSIFCLWLAVGGLLWTGSRVARPAVWLLAPYFVWVTFASTLNFGILSLNVLKQRTEELEKMPANQDPKTLERRVLPQTRR